MGLFRTISGFMRDYVMTTRDCDDDILAVKIYLAVCLTKKILQGKKYYDAVIECIDNLEQIALEKLLGEKK